MGNAQRAGNEKFSLEGSVSARKGGYARQLGRFTMSGPLHEVCTLDIPKASTAWHWVSRSPPDYNPEAPDDYLMQVLKAMGWGNEWVYWGPPYTEDELFSWRKHGGTWTP